MWAHMRTIRIADGPDEVHLQQMARNENKRNQLILNRFDEQKKRMQAKMKEYGFVSKL
jgi:acyl-CoA dehydrogenase